MTTRKRKRSIPKLRGQAKSTVQHIEEELPPELRHYARRMRQGLSQLEKQLASAQKDARRRFAQLLREASHQLGRVEALGEREWRKRTTQARRDAVKLLRRLEKAIELPRRRSAPRRKPAKPVVARRVEAPARRAAPAAATLDRREEPAATD
jgi:dsDNA-specific endonuclease/ATPase MutS2